MNAQPPPGATVLYLIRHGATEANERTPFILQGDAIDLPLSAAGAGQATAVAELLAGQPIAAVYSSGLLRARETAAAVAAPHALAPTVVADLQECNVGQWEGLDWETVRRTCPEAHRKFVEDPAENPNLGGESYGDVLRRVQPVLDGLIRRHSGESIAVVAHNVVNRVYLSQLLGIALRQAASIRQANGGVNVIHQDSSGNTALVTLNSTFHLAGLSSRQDPAR